jgi:hypothetical protein
MVAREYHTGQVIRLWQDQFGHVPPYSIGPDCLFVAYYASAELGCHLALGWPMPARILDLCAEFRLLTNITHAKYHRGMKRKVDPSRITNKSLLGALVAHGLDSIGATEKKEMRDLVMGGGPWDDDQRAGILDYCQSDVDALARLLPAMLPKIDLPRALLRGRYMVASAKMEWAGVPIDVPTLNLLISHWEEIQDELVAEVDANYGVYEGRSFRTDKFEAWLVQNGIPWPRREDGGLDLEDDTFRQMAKSHPIVSPLRELRYSLSKLRLNDLTVGRDGRNRCLLSAFQAMTGRTQPSNSKFVFGPSVWMRGVIKPPPGYGIAYLDYQQQEFAIAAALSGDENMKHAYLSGDPYLEFAKLAKAVPQDAVAKEHKGVRNLYKQCVLATQYGQGEYGLAVRIDKPTIVARSLLRAHKETFSTFWKWSEAAVSFAMLHGYIYTVFGWTVNVVSENNPRALMNYPMQANGAEMTRLAACLATEAGVEVCCTVHDALLICAPTEQLDAAIATTREAMREASLVVLDGFEVRTDVDVVLYPDRFMDEDRGKEMWDKVIALTHKIISATQAA